MKRLASVLWRIQSRCMTSEFVNAVRNFLDQHPDAQLDDALKSLSSAIEDRSPEAGRVLMLCARSAASGIVSDAADELRCAYERALPNAVAF